MTTHDAHVQLYINYKLKSVAALPWRQMTFKFLNTIIDDLFAFVIKMPWLHRLSVFRDDLVFLVYIYQRYAYRVDKKRPNEFGYASFPVYRCHSCYAMLYCVCKCMSLLLPSDLLCCMTCDSPTTPDGMPAAVTLMRWSILCRLLLCMLRQGLPSH